MISKKRYKWWTILLVRGRSFEKEKRLWFGTNKSATRTNNARNNASREKFEKERIRKLLRKREGITKEDKGFNGGRETNLSLHSYFKYRN